MQLSTNTPISLSQDAIIREGHIYYFTLSDHPSLAEALKKPHAFFIEMGEYVHLSAVQDMLRLTQPDFCLSLTSLTAFQQPVSEFLMHYLDARFAFNQRTFDHIKTCLQEAIANSVIHGNLNIHPQGNSAEDFQAYYDSIQHRLHDPELGMYRVSVFAWYEKSGITLCVADQGKGFDIQQAEPAITDLHGRGLSLIRAMSERVWQTRPNHLFMKFGW